MTGNADMILNTHFKPYLFFISYDRKFESGVFHVDQNTHDQNAEAMSLLRSPDKRAKHGAWLFVF